ncbi:MAG: cation-translocating P-type ATPase [Rhodospirillaceae bacterium]|nr:cation-translocating P-type ATPase [Rhodospirillaceae bacterium]
MAMRDLLRMLILLLPLGTLALSGAWWEPSPLAPLLPFTILPLLLAAFVQFGLGGSIYRKGLADLSAGRVTADLLLVVGASAAFALALWQAWFLQTAGLPAEVLAAAQVLVWRDAAFGASLLAVALLGELALRRSLGLPSANGASPPVGLAAGERLTVAPGGLIPCDGVVGAGSSEIQDPLGRAGVFPVLVGPGDPVHAGSRNGDGALEIIADVPSPPARIENTSIDGLATVLSRATQAMILLAMAALAWRLMQGPPLRDPVATILRLVALTAPLGLGLVLAAPAAELIAAARRHGIEIRDLALLDRLSRIRAVLFAHRGILIPERHRAISAQTPGGDAGSELIGRAAAVAQAGHDPWGHALLEFAVRYRMRLKPASEYRAVIGEGIAATVGDIPTVFGTRDFVAGHGVDCTPLDAAAAEVLAEGRQVRWVAETGRAPRLLGFIIFGAPAAAGAAHAVKNLDRLGLEVTWLADPTDPAIAAVARQIRVSRLYAPLAADLPRVLAEMRQSCGPLLVVTSEAPPAGVVAGDVVLPFGPRAAGHAREAGIRIIRQDPRLVVDLLLLASRFRRLILANLAIACVAAMIVAFLPLLTGRDADLGAYEIGVILLLAVSSLSLRTMPGTANEVDEE